MRVAYLSPSLTEAAELTEPRLAATTERHKIELAVPVLHPVSNAWEAVDKPGIDGAVLSLQAGSPGRVHLKFAQRLLRSGRRTWLYWPQEDAVEAIDAERLASYWRHWVVVQAFRQARRLKPAPVTQPAGSSAIAEAEARVREVLSRAAPVPFDPGAPGARVAGTGVYLRTDYWARIDSGGSYGHTCYVAKELAASTEHFVAFMGHRYDLLDEWKLQQVVLQPTAGASESDLLASSAYYYERLRPAIEVLRPAYIYERLCLGNFAGARLSQDLGVPYIVEYNGSELSMRRSFQGDRYVYEEFYLNAEMAAFKQASMISVVSKVVRDELLARGIDADKILVNPNGVDPSVFAPPTAAEHAALKRELGWSGDHCVVGFIGTFGGWHGVDVLAAALPEICRRAAAVRFLLIGDGTHKPMLDEAIAKAGLESRVHRTGRVQQREGARLLRAADLFVSPHSSHMVDSRFFGSPTKLFEYMSLGGGIVASDLEQIGEVLSPALRPGDLREGVSVTDQRAVLCKPGSVEEFVEAVVGLSGLPQVAAALGRNARAAVERDYSWRQHVAHVWDFARGHRREEAVPAARRQTQSALIEQELQQITTGDEYKDQVQNQWNNNPVGSQYVKEAQPHTLEWFLEVEAHRYGVYGPWMPETMEFAKHRGEKVLEIGGGMGTDLSQFAKNGALTTDVDLSGGHLALAQENFKLRGLAGRFIHQDAERLPFEDNEFDVVYSNGVIHHTPNTAGLVDEIYRVLKPGGRAIIMVYAENSLHYWGVQVGMLGLRGGMLEHSSVGDIMSRSVEMTANDARPLVKVYTKRRLRQMFHRFTDISIVKRQLTKPEIPAALRWLPLDLLGRMMGWNLILKATKPR